MESHSLSSLLEETQLARKEGMSKDLKGRLARFHQEMSKSAPGLNKQAANEQISQTLRNYGMCLSNTGRHAEALSIVQLSLQYAYSSEQAQGIGDCLISVGYIQLILGNMSLALEAFLESNDIAQQNGLVELLAGSSINIGKIYHYLRDYTKCRHYWNSVLEMDISTNMRILTLSNIGSSYHMEKDFEHAVEYLEQAMELTGENDYFNIHNYYNLATSYCKVNRLDDAFPLAETVYQYAESSQNPYDHWLASHLRAELLLYEDRAEESIVCSEDSLEISNKHNLKAERAANFELLANAYEQMSNWEKALEFYKLEQQEKSEQEYQSTRERLEQHEDEIKFARADEQAKVLGRVLPNQIAERIIEGEEQIADYFESVSILFADLKGFTSLTRELKPMQVVQLLDAVFAHYDAVIKKHGCTKIKTIGDGYMAVAGAPDQCDDHAERLAAAAIDMQQAIDLPESVKSAWLPGTKLEARIGIHTGSVIAGVVGAERFVYDIYSDAVNIASRMESTSEVGKVQISEPFKQLLESRMKLDGYNGPKWTFEAREAIEVKGVGEMRTYYLTT